MAFPIYDSFPYNENQKYLHVPEKQYLKNIEAKVHYSGKSENEKKKFRNFLLAKVQKIKNQYPHPAKVLAPFPHYFGDYDVYWMHWDWHKKLIIPRMLGIDLDKEIEVLEGVYSKEEIVNTMRKTREHVNPDKFEFLSNRYEIELTMPIHKIPASYAS